MAIMSDRYKFADEKAVNVSLRAVVGGYELVLGITGTVDPQRDEPHWLTIHSGRVSARSAAGQQDIGTARPSLPATIRQHANPGYFAIELILPVSPAGLSNLEDHRDGGDIDFDITLAGISGAKHPSDAPEHQVVRGRVGQKDWVTQLASVKAKDILILEVPMPLSDGGARQKSIFNHIVRAQKLFGGGLYAECVAECRKGMEEFESTKGPMKWQALGAKPERESLGKLDRLRSMIGVVHHFTHLAGHSASRGGIAEYSRADAKLILTVLAAFVAHEASE